MYFLVGTAIFALALCSEAEAQSTANPDAGKLMRLICVSTSELGSEETLDWRDVLVVQQVTSRHADASYFVPGNQNYREISTRRENFRVFRLRGLETAVPGENIEDTVEAILSGDTSGVESYSGAGTRARERLKVNFTNGVIGSISYSRTNQNLSTFRISNPEFFFMEIYCYDPFSI